MERTIRFFPRILAALVLFTFATRDSCRAQSLNNIFGTGADTLVNGPVFSQRCAALPNHFTRFTANWFEINPAPGVFNFTNAPSGNDAMIAVAAAQGRAILFDVNGWPAWVQADWKNRYQHMADYVTAVLTRWPQIQILGCWNEPSWTHSARGDIVPNIPVATPLQLMTEYHVLVTTIYNAKQAVNTAVQLNVGKFIDFAHYVPCLQLLRSLGTWTMADYITWHDGYNTNYPALTDIVIQGVTVPSAAHKIAFARALFPGKMVGSDEYSNYELKSSIQAAAAYRAAGASMMIDCLIAYPTPANPSQQYALCYGVDPVTSQFSTRSKVFINLLTMPPEALAPVWNALQNAPSKGP
jgi:hypothetical protein